MAYVWAATRHLIIIARVATRNSASVWRHDVVTTRRAVTTKHRAGAQHALATYVRALINSINALALISS